MGVALVYSGLVALALGLLSMVKPLRLLGIPTRRRGAVGVAGGVLLIACGVALPARAILSTGPRQRLDDFLPEYQFSERHEVQVKAPPARVFSAIKAVTAGEIRFFQTLTWIRSPRIGRPARETILAAPSDQPILEVATRSGFVLLAEEADRELVIGAVLGRPRGIRPPPRADFLAFSEAGYAKVAMNFRIAPGDGLSTVTTETRVMGTDDAATRGFAAYWRVIYPGSALIRTMWLRAIKERAERPPPRRGSGAPAPCRNSRSRWCGYPRPRKSWRPVPACPRPSRPCSSGSRPG